MSGMPWFRMYSEMIEDPKVGSLQDGEFRLWVELLCLACLSGADGDTQMTIEELNWKLRRNVSETFLKLQCNNLVVSCNVGGRETVKITNWNKRQYPSDNSTSRVIKFRKNNAIPTKKGNVSETFLKRKCNGIDTDTDTDNKRLFVGDSDEVRLSEILFSKILLNNRNAKKPNIQSWAKHIDLMIRVDKRPPADIESVIVWCQSDTFWMNNILSTAKLREKYDQLSLKMGRNIPRPTIVPPTGPDGKPETQEERIRRLCS